MRLHPHALHTLARTGLVLCAAGAGAALAGTQSFTTPGAYLWPVPPGVTQVNVVVTGGGGGGGQSAGGPGGQVTVNAIPVTQGSSLSVFVGGGGSGTPLPAGGSAGGGGASFIATGVGGVIGGGGGGGGWGGIGATCVPAANGGTAGSAITSTAGGKGGDGSVAITWADPAGGGTQTVPTLSQWALVALASALGLATALMRRRR